MHEEKQNKFYLSLLAEKMLKAEASFLKEKLNYNDNIIDVGCGTGVLERMLKSFDIVGVYDSNDQLAIARRKSKNLFVKGVAENLPFLKEEFKVGIINLSVSYVKDWKKAINELHAVLEKSGSLFIFVINPDIDIKNIKEFKEGFINNNINLSDIESHLTNLFKINEFYPIKFKIGNKNSNENSKNINEIIITAILCNKT
ncbi:MAG: class I SAM-dependent methyltransferase [Candidatus Micrarchaeia archaeon]